MVHIVKKNIHGEIYLYLQRSVYDKGKRKTKHVAYLGLKKELNKKQIKRIIAQANKLNWKNRFAKAKLDYYIAMVKTMR